MNWYIKVIRNFVNFKGRARRKEYWMFQLFNFLIAFSLGVVAGIVDLVSKSGNLWLDGTNLAYTLFIFLPSLAVGVRRIHDIGRTGWWVIVPVVGLVFLFFKTQPQDNDYGPNPKAI